MAPRPAYGSFIRQNEKPRLETRRRNHVRGHHADRPAHARDQALSARHAEGHRDTQRDARRFRPTRSPGRPDTNVPAVGRRTARAATGAGSPPRPSGSPWRWRGGGSGRTPGACARRRRGTAYLLPEFPAEHRRRIRTNNMIERLNREVRRRTRVVGGFPYGDSALMLACARIRYVTANE